MLEEALRYPTAGERGLERLLLGGVAVLLSFLVVPVLLVYGYLVRSLAAVAAGEEEPPGFDRWEQLFLDGLKAVVVAFVYGVVPLAVAFAVFVPVSAVSVAGGADPARAMGAVGALSLLVLVAVALVVAYVVMAALSTFAVEGRLAAAFDVGAVAAFATSGPYLLAIVLALVVQVVVGLVALLAVVFSLGLALLVLVPLGAFVNFWVYLATVYLFGAAYREAMGDVAA